MSLRPLSLFTLMMYLNSVILFPLAAQAEVGNTSLTGGAPVSQTGSSSGSGGGGDGIDFDACEDICKPFAWSENASSRSGYPGLLGTSTWSTTDDLLCQNMGSPTAAGYSNRLPAPDAVYTANNPGCNVNMSPDVIAAVKDYAPGQPESTYCALAGQLKDHCKYHNSQLEPQCVAYNSFSQPVVANGVMAGIDGAVAAYCGICCFFVATPPPAHAVCGGLAAAAGAAEFATTMAMKQNSDIAKYVGMIGGLAGVGIGVAGLIDGATDASAAAKAKGAGGGSAPASAPASASGSGSAAQNASKADEAERNKMSCATAVLFAAMMGFRIYNITQMDKSKGKACEAIQKLQGKIDSKLAAKQAATSAAKAAATSGGDNSGGYTVSSGKTASAANQLASYTNCTNSGGGAHCDASCVSTCVNQSGINPQTLSATDGQAISQSGMPQQAMNMIPDPKSFLETAKKDGAGAALGSIMPSSAGPVANALGAIANEVQNHPELLEGYSLPAAYGGGGGGGGGGGPKGDNPFASMFAGAGGAPAGPGAPNSMQFGTSTGPDIWHSKSTENIFQIVSEKIGKVTPRVQ